MKNIFFYGCFAITVFGVMADQGNWEPFAAALFVMAQVEAWEG